MASTHCVQQPISTRDTAHTSLNRTCPFEPFFNLSLSYINPDILSFCLPQVELFNGRAAMVSSNLASLEATIQCRFYFVCSTVMLPTTGCLAKFECWCRLMRHNFDHETSAISPPPPNLLKELSSLIMNSPGDLRQDTHIGPMTSLKKQGVYNPRTNFLFITCFATYQTLFVQDRGLDLFNQLALICQVQILSWFSFFRPLQIGFLALIVLEQVSGKSLI